MLYRALYRLTPAVNPKPVQRPHPPLVFGGESEAALRRAAALGDGWYGFDLPPGRSQPAYARSSAAAGAQASSPRSLACGAGADAARNADLAPYASPGCALRSRLASAARPRCRTSFAASRARSS
jgi:alkanesulfonate monooxygenase SsuD/methylene tetrahydromethanopterin reductase-like flavin-dependent oxidoreductase (luciferase family)